MIKIKKHTETEPNRTEAHTKTAYTEREIKYVWILFMVLIELKHENQTLIFQRRTTLTTSHHTQKPAIRSSLSLGQSENPIARYDDLKRREKKKKQRSENEVFARLFDLVTTWMETEIRFQPPKTSITTIIKD